MAQRKWRLLDPVLDPTQPSGFRVKLLEPEILPPNEREISLDVGEPEGLVRTPADPEKEISLDVGEPEILTRNGVPVDERRKVVEEHVASKFAPERIEAPPAVQMSATTTDAELDAARERARMSRLAADLGAAGQLAIGGSTASFDKDAADADRPVNELLARRKAVEDAVLKKRGQDREDKDLELRTNERRDRLAEDKRRAQVAEEDRDLERGRREAEGAERAGDRAADRELRVLLAQMSAKTASDLKLGQTLDRETQALEKRVPTEAAAMLEKLKRLRAEVPAQGDVPGIGPLDRLAPDFLASEKGQNIRQDVSGVISTLLAIQSGKAVSEKEVARKRTELGLGDGSPDKMFRRGLDNLEAEIRATLRQKTSGFSPGAVETYKRQGGVTEADLPNQAPQRVVVSNGKETLEIDAADLADAERDGFKRTR